MPHQPGSQEAHRSARRGRTATLAFLLVAVLLLSGLASLPRLSGSSPALQGSPPPEYSAGSLAASPRASVPFMDGAPGEAIPLAPYTGSVSVLVTFSLANASQAAELLGNLSNPASPTYHHYLTQSQFAAEFSPSEAFYTAATAYFEGYPGLRVTPYADRLSLRLEGPAGVVGSIFGVTLEQYSAAGRGTYFAPGAEPSLPALLASEVVGVTGLSNFLLAQNDLGATRGLPVPLPATGPNAGYPAPIVLNDTQYLFGSDMQVAYDEQSLLNITYPRNEVVATILWAGCSVRTSFACPASSLTGSFDPSDIETYLERTLPAGQPLPTVTGVPLDGAPPPGASAHADVTTNVEENTLDLEMIGSTAPGASIYNVYTPNATVADATEALAYILNPSGTPGLQNVSVISNSWGGNDLSNTTWNEYVEEATMRGITIVASSGDAGSDPSSAKWEGADVEFPSNVANDTWGVLAVGGTTDELAVSDNQSDDYLHLTNQTVWWVSANDSADGGPAGSSGGISRAYAEPSWQLDTEANDLLHGQGRGTPDLAALANNTIIYLNASSICPDGVCTPSGTSIAAPLTAGLLAEIDAVLAHYGQSPLGFVDPTIYNWANEMLQPFPGSGWNAGPPNNPRFNSTLPSLPFDDVTWGANARYSARVGYDLATGWGSLDANNFTTYVLTYNYSGHAFALNGVRDALSLSGLQVRSPDHYYNASLQQNLFLANAQGQPLYWIQNVIYIRGDPSSGWEVNYTSWAIFPFYGFYSSGYESNAPQPGTTVFTPLTWTVTSWLSNNGPNAVMNYQINSHLLQLPVPGASFIIGGYNYSYYWQGRQLTNGPYPAPDVNGPGGLAPQFGLVGGPSLGKGNFTDPTAGNLTSSIELSGQGAFIPAPHASTFDESADQTGEVAKNLAWEGSGSLWNLTVVPGSSEQGIVAYGVANAGNPASAAVPLYPVTFSESGLPSGTPWHVTIAGVQRSSTSSTLSVSVPNGTYAYAISDLAGWHQRSLPYTGSVTVYGAAITEPTLAFAPMTYTVTITETGLTSGTWSVTLGGNSSGSIAYSAPVTFLVGNGTFNYTVGSVSGYTASPSGGTVLVRGANPSPVDVLFSSIPSSSSSSGLPEWAYAAVGVAVAAVVVALGVALLRQRRPPKTTPSSPAPTPPATP